MNEFNKRILTSLFLIFILYLSITNIYLLTLFFILIFFETLFEFYKIQKKIIKNNLYSYLTILMLIIIIFNILFQIWIIIFNNDLIGKLHLTFIISICILTDIGGYIFGKIFKGKKLTKISPKKTYSGMIGSFSLSIIITLFLFQNFFSTIEIIAYSFIISAISQFGDLLISFIKRKAKIKDTGNILPGHGGVLDRLDGIFFAIPMGIMILNIF